MFREIGVEELPEDIFTGAGRGYMLVSAGSGGNFNFVAASWGSLGQLWDRTVATVYLRRSSGTKTVADKAGRYALSFFTQGHGGPATDADKLGGDMNAAGEAGLTPYLAEDVAAFEQADLILICRKLYHMPISGAGFAIPDLMRDFYPEKNFHSMYMGEVVKILVKAASE
ncbi:MAG: hypothetical protein FWG17_02735 [Desulfovibrionaceae bacterium]|nr:hypothetical protein [Desulfovibrionaceae bacterium]